MHYINHKIIIQLLAESQTLSWFGGLAVVAPVAPASNSNRRRCSHSSSKYKNHRRRRCIEREWWLLLVTTVIDVIKSCN
jgi:hypothetical protein